MSWPPRSLEICSSKQKWADLSLESIASYVALDVVFAGTKQALALGAEAGSDEIGVVEDGVAWGLKSRLPSRLQCSIAVVWELWLKFRRKRLNEWIWAWIRCGFETYLHWRILSPSKNPKLIKRKITRVYIKIICKSMEKILILIKQIRINYVKLKERSGLVDPFP